MKMFNLSVTNNAGWWQKKDEKFEEAGRGGAVSPGTACPDVQLKLKERMTGGVVEKKEKKKEEKGRR